MAYLPQAECRHRWQERDSSAEGVEPGAAEKAAMARIMADQEQADDGGRDDEHADQLECEAAGQQDQRGAGTEERQVEQ